MYRTIKRISEHIQSVQRMMRHITDEIIDRSHKHDASKYNENELKGYIRFEEMPDGLEYGSDEYKKARANVMKNNNCFELHSQTNDHHPEYWDCPEQNVDLSFMGLFPLMEMVCDWAGAYTSYGNTGTWMESVDYNVSRFDFNDKQKYIIYEFADFLQRKDCEIISRIEKIDM